MNEEYREFTKKLMNVGYALMMETREKGLSEGKVNSISFDPKDGYVTVTVQTPEGSRYTACRFDDTDGYTIDYTSNRKEKIEEIMLDEVVDDVPFR